MAYLKMTPNKNGEMEEKEPYYTLGGNMENNPDLFKNGYAI